MKLRKIVFVVRANGNFRHADPWLPGLGGGGPEPPTEGATIHGPEIWGVVVCDNSKQLLIVRLKRVVNCVVETETYVEEWPFLCPANATAALDFGPAPADGIHFFSLPDTPYVTKVKNFKTEGTLCSFDAQFMFWKE